MKSLHLHQFRSYKDCHFSVEGACVVLTGPNGVGKTNLLEGLSFLIPGRGLRRARFSDITHQGYPGPWSLSYRLQEDEGDIPLGTGQDPEALERRITKINGQKLKDQSILAEWVSMVWLTPQMDRLFLDGPSERRRFLDRLVYGVDPTHAARLTRYEKAVRERNFLLRQGKLDPYWLEGLEEVMVNEGMAITIARRDVVGQLVTVLESQNPTFPTPSLKLEGDLETLLQTRSSLEAEDVLRSLLKQNRLQDRVSGRTSLGAHRSDLGVVYREKNQPAALCSTGEQKALLLSIVMAAAYLLSARTEAIPLLLLDEVVAHLDKNRRKALFEVLLQLKMQVWLTGTDLSLFEGLHGKAQFINLSPSSSSALNL